MPTPAAVFEPCTRKSRREGPPSAGGGAVVTSFFLVSLMFNLLCSAVFSLNRRLIASSLEVVPGGQGEHIGLIRRLGKVGGRLRPVGPEMLPLQPHHQIRPNGMNRRQIGTLVGEVLDT